MKTITIELAENEALWIVDKVAKECLRGNEVVDSLADCTDPDIQKELEMAKEIVTTLAKLGLKIVTALKSIEDE